MDPELAHGLAPHVETALYFVVAEGMTNVAKHSGASRATVVARIEDGPVATWQADTALPAGFHGVWAG